MCKEESQDLHIYYKIKFQKKLDFFPESWAYGTNFRDDNPDVGWFRPHSVSRGGMS
jgi:hypothetical protein